MFKMARKKKSKLSTPDWILEGYDSESDYLKSKGMNKKKKEGKTFKIRECPKCGSDDVGIVLSNSDSEESPGTGKDWECRKCGWIGQEINEKELTEDEFMEYLDNKGEEVA
jgi:DNA-directed RNA polymerase subunit M/transcription elongation factor TFIIS